MKNVIFILAINFIMSNCLEENPPTGTFNSFLSLLGVNIAKSPSQYERLKSDSNPDDLNPQYDPLDLLVVKLDGKVLTATIGNGMLLGQIIRGDEFVDLLFACQKDDENPLVIVNDYKSIVKSGINRANQLIEERNKENGNIPDHEIKINVNQDLEQQTKQTAILHQDEIKNHENGQQSTAMELDSNQQKDAAADTHNFIQNQSSQQEIMHIPEEANEDTNLPLKKRNRPENSPELTPSDDDAVSKKNKVDSVDLQKAQNEEAAGHNKMEIDSASIQKPEGANSDKNEASTSQSEIKKIESPVQKIDDALVGPTPETEKFWVEALHEIKNVKCRKPITSHLFEYPSKSQFKFYLGGFEVIMDNFKDLEIPEAKMATKRKYNWFWSFTIVMTESDLNLVCVYHEIQYNKDTYSPGINNDFHNHDLGKDMMFPGMDMSQLYETKNQEKVFRKLLQDSWKKYFDIAKKNFLVRVHLAPLHGFVSSVTRQFGKTYGNVAPMWNSIRDQAWQKLENFVSILSHVLVDIIVVTGTYGVLNLDNQDIYLASDKKVPVPLAFWKLVVYGSEDKNLHGMLIITFNNPYEVIDNVFCEESVCHRFGWGYIEEDDIAKGRTVCCVYLLDILKHIPILVGIQPSEVLNLNTISKFVEYAWVYNELGEDTTQEERNAILAKLPIVNKKLVDENAAADKKVVVSDEKIATSGEKVPVPDEKVAAFDERSDGDSNNEDDESAPLLAELKGFSFIQKPVEIY